MEASVLLQILTLMERQSRALNRIADSLETIARLQQAEAESFDTGDTPPSVDLAGRPIGAGRG
jgi:hypothetical protein